MFRSNLKIAFRYLWKNSVFSIVNIAGLAVGITCSVILFMFILDELNFDKFHKNADNIYRVYTHININGKESNNAKTACPLGKTMSKSFPEVTAFARLGYFGGHTLRYKDKAFRETDIYAADSTYFTIFSFPFVHGDPHTALIHPNSIVLTEEMAEKYFEKENPVGKSITVDGQNSYMVTAVMKNFPSRSHFSCDFFVSMSTYPDTDDEDWLDLSYSTFILTKKGTNSHDLETKLTKIVIDHVGPQAEKVLGVPIQQFLEKGNSYTLCLQPMASIHLYSARKYGIDSNTEWGNVTVGDIIYVHIFLVVALVILLIAIINFMNLSTARSEKRAKEVGVRKTLGSGRSRLIGQFIIESVLTVSVAVVISLALVQIFLPAFNQIAGKHLSTEYLSDPRAIPALIIFTLVVGALAGSYPAFYLSSFHAVDVLKSGMKKRKAALRSFLVVTQFAISIALIIAMIVIRAQLYYIQHKDLGFDKENLIFIINAPVLGDKIKTFKEELAKKPSVLGVSNHSLMFGTGVPGNGYLFNRRTGTDPMSFQYLNVDCDFIKTYDVKLIKGRFFSENFPTDSDAVVINEAAMKECMSDDPLGKELTPIDVNGTGKPYRIIGVVKDFNYESLRKQISPLVLHLGAVRQPASIVTVRVRPQSVKNAAAVVENTWRQFSETEKCNYYFLDDAIATLYDREKRTGTIATLFSCLAIFIACLGLFGLATFITEQRTKEIGIRKVSGASITEIMITISKPFLIWVMIANLLAWPVAYLIMNKWLQNFAYRTSISFWIFIVAGVAAVIIALFTVSFRAFKAATANPIKSLKTE